MNLFMLLLIAVSGYAETRLQSGQINAPWRRDEIGALQRGTTLNVGQVVALNVNQTVLWNMDCTGLDWASSGQRSRRHCELIFGMHPMALYVNSTPQGDWLPAHRCKNGQPWNGMGCRKDLGTIVPMRQITPNTYNTNTMSNVRAWYQ